MNDFLKPFGSQSFLVGLGAAAIGYLFGPKIKQAVRPAAVKGAQGMMMVTDKTKEMFDEGKHMMGNMMDKTSSMGKDSHVNPQAGMYEILIHELKEERQRSNHLMEQLNTSIVGLKEEFAHMKKSNNDFTPEQV